MSVIVDLCEQLQKLITEKDTSAVLRERVALLKDKVLLLESENVSLKGQVVELTETVRALTLESGTLTKQLGTLGEKNVALEADNMKLQQLIEQLRREIQETKDLSQQRLEHNSHDNLLDEVKAGILKLLFDAGQLEPERLAQALGVGIQVVLFHAEELLKQGYIRQCRIMKEHVEKTENIIRKTVVPVLGLTIDQPGRRYVMEGGR